VSIPHHYRRPEWICVDDGEPWPCAGAQARLIAEHGGDRIALALLLAELYVQAVADTPAGTTAGLLYGRFLGRWR
jgi:hypothetical protein